jgi:DNA-binding winged helix-turn-helix (wHTH) protein
MSFWFGEFELDQERRQLLRSGESVPLEPKAYDLLSLLLERRPRALSRAQIRDAVWPQTFVSESTLAVVVNGIRKALGDDARQPRFVRTVHGFGYAFCGQARTSGEERPAGGEAIREPSPYPGLSAFTEADAERFIGREAEGYCVDLDPTGTVVAAGSSDGIVRIGPTSGGEPHIFIGRASAAPQVVAFSPDGRWVASSGEGPSVLLWPVPDVTRTPLHKRGHEEVLATLRSWTNLRVVRDAHSLTGWKLEPGPFPGWAKLPHW